MARRPAAFRQSDVTRAIQGARAAGETVKQVEIDNTGKIVVIVAAEVAKSDHGAEGWDSVT